MSEIKLPEAPKLTDKDFTREGELTDEAYRRAITYAHDLRRIYRNNFKDVPYHQNTPIVTLHTFMETLHPSDQRNFEEQFQISDYFSGREFHTGRF